MEGARRRLFFLLSLFCISLLSLPTSGTDGSPDSTRGAPIDSEDKRNTRDRARPEWQILTKRNFSSQIRAHPHLLLLVTVPWSGESRSLKKDVVNLLSEVQNELSDLKLVLVHKNSDKLISDVLGASEESTLFYYHHSKRFKYRGRMNSRAILSAVLYLMSFPQEQAPLESLNSVEELKKFLNSTDESMLLVEFCGWSSKLLHHNYSGNNDDSVSTGGLYENGETTVENVTTTEVNLLEGKEQLKVIESDQLTCSIDHMKPPWFGASIWGIGNNSDGAAQGRTSNGVYCSKDEFKKFISFFTKFMEVARETLLPPERLRFGYISHKSLLPYLKVESLDTWMLLHWIPGCRSCSKVLREGDDLRAILMHDTPVMELDSDRSGRGFSFPMNMPSIILFIDRSSNSSKIIEDGKSALHFLKMLAQKNRRYGTHTGNHFSFDSVDVRDKNLKVFTKSYSDATSHLMSKSSMQRIIKLNDQMTVMIINQDEQIPTDKVTDVAQGTTAYDLLAHLLQERDPGLDVKKRKLNLLAKEAGFELLSDDFEVKVLESLPSDKANDQSHTTVSNSIMEKNIQFLEHPSEFIDHAEANNIKSSDGFYTINPQYSEASSSKSNTKFISHQSGLETQRQKEFIENTEVTNDGKAEGKTSVEDKESSSLHGATRIGEPTEMTLQRLRFMGSYYVSDGDYTLLEALTGALKLPALTILDPYKEKHYIYEEIDLTHSSLATFIDKYLNGSLSPYHFTKPSLINQRENPLPPFVNRDFHEADAIPRISLRTFSDIIFVGRDYDILVLFSNSWCGFCQRMELVVREVYRSLKGFSSVSKPGYNTGLPHSQDEPENSQQHVVPSIFLMDCTLNDCSSQLNELGKKEHYPALVLFPAQGETIFFEGDVSVNNVIKFLAKYGTSSGILNRYKGVLWTERDIQQETDVSFDSLSILTPSRISENENKHTVIGGATTGGNGHLLTDLHKSVERKIKEENVVVGSVLSATDKLLHAFPFDNSSVLIVRANQYEGFHGMILNKKMNWEVFAKLEEVVAPLKQAPLSYGGPVREPSLPFVSLSRKALQGYTQVSAGLYYGNPMSTGLAIEEIRSGNESAANLWFFFGLSGWEWNQLFGEIARGDWHLSDGPIMHLEWPDS